MTEHTTDFKWVIEAPGANYLAVSQVGGARFYWTTDHNEAIRFESSNTADSVMMTIRDIMPALFVFEATLGNARAVEHGWMTIRRDKLDNTQ